MDKHLWQRIEPLLARYDRAVLATCGPAGPHASQVAYQVEAEALMVFVPHVSDHLFNLEANLDLVLLTAGWQLVGRGVILPDGRAFAAQPWQNAVRVQPLRLHVLLADGVHYAETVDFEDERGAE